MRKYILIFLIILGISFYSCKKFLEPVSDTSRSETELMSDPIYVEGLLMDAYSALPNDYDFGIDVAAGDAVSNLQGSSFTRLATGEWTSSFNPISKWENAFDEIYHINLFLDRYSLVRWASSPTRTQSANDSISMFHLRRLKGEAFGLRAWYEFQLLQFHSGKANDGTFLGFPIILKPVSTTDDWQLPRNTFSDCVKQIMSDLDTAIKYLPKVYADTTGGTAGFKSIYNGTRGVKYENRMNGNASMALKSRVALLAASPAFSAGSSVVWADAAKIAGGLCKNLGALYATGKTFYTEKSNKEIIWNRAVRQIKTWETANFPPSLFGNGGTNPSQSLVDAFPMKNGYPINNALSLFNSLSPYNLRDLRLSDYIIYNGSIFKSTVINTYIDADIDGINTLVSSTRSGYYLKKFMSEGVSLNPNNSANALHTYTLFRMTEVLLNFAEAANEAWGPDGDPLGLGFTARTKIKDLRSRAGITAPDPYVATLTTKDSFRELILNERRIELCFEGFRFWDVRRLNRLTEMTSPVSGVFISQQTGIPTSYSYSKIEDRIFSPFMIYGPIPYNESLKYSLIQNAGW
jgi:starch-binding outer membrane protein, SusD/RagB family